MPFFDTNILLYSISTDPADAAKRDRAVALLSDPDGALSIQVLQEFYYQATRPTRREPLTHEAAVDLVTRLEPISASGDEPRYPERGARDPGGHRFSYWDCAIIAAARALGCLRIVYGGHEPWPRGRGRPDRQPVPLTRQAQMFRRLNWANSRWGSRCRASRTRGCCAAAAGMSTTWCCRAWCSAMCCARRTPTRASRASTQAALRPRRAYYWS